MRIEVLGPLAVLGDGLSTPDRASHRRLLSILALEGGRRIGTERLIDLFWGDSPPDQSKASLQTHISALRRHLSPDLIATEGYGYRLDLDHVSLDVADFTTAANAARRAAAEGHADRIVKAASAALDLWGGAPYPELSNDHFARPEIVRLEGLHAEMWELWAHSLVELGRHVEALSELEHLVVRYPFRERLWESLMTACYRLGRHVEALEAYRDHCRALAERGLEPGPSLQRLEEKILLHEAELRQAPNNLPSHLTSFVGRAGDRAEVAKLIGGNRLVTLVGVGGAGKTRLALQVADDLLGSFADGCWFVELADLRDPDQVAFEVATALGRRSDPEDPVGSLATSIRHESMLLIVDNCEHLLEGTATLVQSILAGGETVGVLATSREPLHMAGEVVYEVPPLEVPAPAAEASEIQGYDAVRLFEDRASLADPTLRLGHRERGLIASICRRLDGIPLAIELAAAKVRVLTLAAIDSRLEQGLRLLATKNRRVPRHRTLEAAIAWSFQLLDESERALLAILSVFRGGFELEMAERVAGDFPGEDVVSVLESLIDKSLVSRDRGRHGRYRLLEAIREFAVDRLVDSALQDEVSGRFLSWCVEFAAGYEERVFQAGRLERLEHLGVESDNLQAGLELAKEIGDASASSVIGAALERHWFDIRDLSRCRLVLETSLVGSGDPLVEAGLRSRLARACFLLGDGNRAMAESGVAVDLVQDLAGSAEKAVILGRHASLHMILVDQDPQAAVSLARRAVAAAESSGREVAIAQAMGVLGDALAWNGEADEGLRVLDDALEIATATGDSLTILEIYDVMFEPLHAHPQRRRTDPIRLAEGMGRRFPDSSRSGHLSGWYAYASIQSGDWDRASDLIERHGARGLQAFDQIGYLMTRGTLRWMQGRLDDAEDAMVELERLGVNPRWFHDYYPLRADLAADRGDVRRAREWADLYLAHPVDASEMAKKLGVLHALVRAETEAGLRSTGGEAADHARRATETVARMRKILEEFPPPTEGSVAMETHGTHLAFAQAELSRVEGPDPALWQTAADRADYIYFRLYARTRLAEALLQTGREREGRREAQEVVAETARIGASRLHAIAGSLRA